MHEAACHRVLRVHVRGLQTNSGDEVSERRRLTADSRTSSPPPLPAPSAPPAGYMMLRAHFSPADLQPLFFLLAQSGETTLGGAWHSLHSVTVSDSTTRSYSAKLLQKTHIT